jgi:signal transduction histidine kinase
VARAVGVMGFVGLIVIVLIGFLSVELLRRVSVRESIDDAKQVTRLAGEGIVAPALTGAVLAGDPSALQRLDRIVRSRVLAHGFVRVKLWSLDGRVVYSDEARLIGRRFPLTREELSAVRTGAVRAEISSSDRPANRFERRLGKLLEVYLPIIGPGGRPLLFESYQPLHEVTSSAQRLWVSFAPALLGGLLLFELIQLPIAWAAARRLRQGHLEREALLRRAVEASEEERSRISRDLHDGVVQDLAGVAYSLEAATQQLGAEPPAIVADRLGGAIAATRRSIRQLRSLLVEIYPASLQRAGLATALSDMSAQFGSRDIDVRVEVESSLELRPETEALLFRVAQESLRNVAAHARATQVVVHVGTENGSAAVTIADDGRGFSPDAIRRRERKGHFGLGFLDDLVRAAGGRLEIDSSPGRGTRARAEVPAP